MTIKKSLLCLSGMLLIPVAGVNASATDACLADAVRNAETGATAETIVSRCQGVETIPERALQERLTEHNDFILTPHKPTYILPFTVMDEPNQEPFSLAEIYDVEDWIDEKEAKFQISIKVPLTFKPLLSDDDIIYVGFTLKSFWQVYNSEVSAPFRETNYQPEIFYQTSLPWRPWDGALFFNLGLEHESNGRTQYLSRSWNRAYVKLAYLQPDWAIAIRPWYRLPEDAKTDDGDPFTPPPPQGDDNPDIEDYMGHHELQGVYKFGKIDLAATTRYNFKTGYGSAELGVSFPFYGKLKGYIQYFNGYGESLIDYNERIERLGVGILVTEWY
jgi:phospholipase A1